MEPLQIALIVGAALLVVLVGFLVLRTRGHRSQITGSGTSGTLSSGTLGAALRRAWSGRLEEQTWQSMEEALLAADVGVAAASAVVTAVQKGKPDTFEEAQGLLARELKDQFHANDRSLNLGSKPTVIVVVGVNGAGKTTSIAKLAHHLQSEGKSVILGAADTFRAAAADQLVLWGERLGVRVVRGNDGADPASVVYDTLSAARSGGVDVVLIDTAGRLHDKKNLMSELGKIYRVATEGGNSVGEVLLTLDATAGQNGLAQAAEFAGTVPVTGVVLTKLDGTARGGIVVAVENQLGIPIKFVGLGESLDDLQAFDPSRFVEELLEKR